MQKFLIIQTSFIGDVVLATAVAEKIHQHLPDARIDFLVRKGNEALFQGHPFIANVWVWNKKNNKLLNLLKLGTKLRRQRYDEVINLHRFFSSGLITWLSGARTKRGFDKNPLSFLYQVKKEHEIGAGGNMHEIERNQQLISDFTGPSAAKPRLYPQTADYEQVKKLQHGPYLCCAPASVWFTKQYPKSRWIDFLKKVPADIQVYLLGGPGDTNLCEEIRSRAGNSNITSLSGQLSYLESTALMGGALMNFVNDSAPLHFASAINAPVTAIYCSTVPAFGYGPLSDIRHILEINYQLHCRPCGLRGYEQCPELHFKCAYDIPDHSLIEILYESRNR